MKKINQTNAYWTDIYIDKGVKLLSVTDPLLSPVENEFVAIGANMYVVNNVENYIEENISLFYVSMNNRSLTERL